MFSCDTACHSCQLISAASPWSRIDEGLMEALMFALARLCRTNSAGQPMCCDHQMCSL